MLIITTCAHTHTNRMKLKRGKSKKETWKKLRSCDDIDQFLVDKREAEVRGDDNNDSSFFFFDTKKVDLSDVPVAAGDAAAQVVVGPVDVRKLRCFAGIYRNPSAVKDPVVKRNAIKTKEKRVKLGETVPKKPAAAISSAPYDLWAPAPTATTATTTSAAPKKRLRPRRGYTPSLVPTIEIPPGGLSVNPSFLDHQDLLRSALSDVLAKKKNPAPRKIFAPETKPEADLKEESEDESAVATVVRKQPAPKTKSARRKQMEERLKEEARKKQKELKKKENEVYKIKGMKRAMDEVEKVSKLKQEARMKVVKERELFGVKELSKFKFKDTKDPVTLRGDLNLRLRELKGATRDLLTDRFKSLQKRNVIEVRVKNRQKRKHRGKRYVRGSDKMDWEKSGEWNGVKVGHLFDQKKKKTQK